MTSKSKSKKVYGVKIATGGGDYRWLTGWDAAYPTRAEAKACAVRASKHEGWSAKVVTLSAEG